MSYLFNFFCMSFQCVHLAIIQHTFICQHLFIQTSIGNASLFGYLGIQVCKNIRVDGSHKYGWKVLVILVTMHSFCRPFEKWWTVWNQKQKCQNYNKNYNLEKIQCLLSNDRNCKQGNKNLSSNEPGQYLDRGPFSKK